MFQLVRDSGAYDPSARHAYFYEDGVQFEVTNLLGIGYPCSVKVTRPYRHLDMISDERCEDDARAIARKYLNEKES